MVRANRLALTWIVLSLNAGFAVSEAVPSERRWSDTPRDVYISGVLDRQVQTLSASSPRGLAVIAVQLTEIPVLNLSGEGLEVRPKTAIRFSDSKASRGVNGKDGTG